MLLIKEGILKLLNVNSIEEANPLLYRWFYSIQRMRSYRTIEQIEYRKRLDLFNYLELSKELSCNYIFEIKENNFYGNAKVLSRNFPITSYTRVEHGLYLGSVVPSRNMAKNTNKIITLSEYRKNYIEKKTDCEVICVGPYIQYAENLFSDEYMDRMKEILGRVLLVFPSHSIDALHASFNTDELIDTIKQYQTCFNTVLVCLYWKDIALGYAKLYEKAGFRVVTAGNIYDYYFLDRLRTIIELSDMTLSNNVGTHVGYCVSMNKPHYIFNSSVKYIPGNVSAQREIKSRDNENYTSMKEAENEILDNFSNFQETISRKQIECVNYYWGKTNQSIQGI